MCLPACLHLRRLSALADPMRRAILARLARGEATVTDLAAPFAMSLPAVSKHLKVLERAGLITRGREAQWRPCRLRAEPLGDVAEWVTHRDSGIWAHDAVAVAADPRAGHRLVPGQGHGVDLAVIAPILAEFFDSS